MADKNTPEKCTLCNRSHVLCPPSVKNRTCYMSVICNLWHLGTLMLSPKFQSAQMSKITNDSLTRTGTGCFIAYPHGNSGRQRVFMAVRQQLILLCLVCVGEGSEKAAGRCPEGTGSDHWQCIVVVVLLLRDIDVVVSVVCAVRVYHSVWTTTAWEDGARGVAEAGDGCHGNGMCVCVCVCLHVGDACT